MSAATVASMPAEAAVSQDPEEYLDVSLANMSDKTTSTIDYQALKRSREFEVSEIPLPSAAYQKAMGVIESAQNTKGTQLALDRISQIAHKNSARDIIFGEDHTQILSEIGVLTSPRLGQILKQNGIDTFGIEASPVVQPAINRFYEGKTDFKQFYDEYVEANGHDYVTIANLRPEVTGNPETSGLIVLSNAVMIKNMKEAGVKVVAHDVGLSLSAIQTAYDFRAQETGQDLSAVRDSAMDHRIEEIADLAGLGDQERTQLKDFRKSHSFNLTSTSGTFDNDYYNDMRADDSASYVVLKKAAGDNGKVALYVGETHAGSSPFRAAKFQSFGERLNDPVVVSFGAEADMVDVNNNTLKMPYVQNQIMKGAPGQTSSNYYMLDPQSGFLVELAAQKGGIQVQAQGDQVSIDTTGPVNIDYFYGYTPKVSSLPATPASSSHTPKR